MTPTFALSLLLGWCCLSYLPGFPAWPRRQAGQILLHTADILQLPGWGWGSGGGGSPRVSVPPSRPVLQRHLAVILRAPRKDRRWRCGVQDSPRKVSLMVSLSISGEGVLLGGPPCRAMEGILRKGQSNPTRQGTGPQGITGATPDPCVASFTCLLRQWDVRPSQTLLAQEGGFREGLSGCSLGRQTKVPSGVTDGQRRNLGLFPSPLGTTPWIPLWNYPFSTLSLLDHKGWLAAWLPG